MLSIGAGQRLFALPLILLLASGCGGTSQGKTTWNDPNPLPADTMTVAAAEIGTHGGRFVIAATAAPKTLNPLMANESSSTDVTNRLFAALTDYHQGRQADIPGIAKSWETSPDGLTWTFHMRRGAAFSDGHPITSDDVLFMFEVALDAEVHPAIHEFLKPGGKAMEVSAPDSYTVVMKLAQPYALMLGTISSLPIMPRHIVEPAYRKGVFPSTYNLSTSPESLVTSGAWKLQQYVPGEKMVLTRNPYWYGVDARGQRLPYLDELVYLIVPDQEAAMLKFMSGEIDGVDNVKTEDYQAYEDQQKAQDFTLYDLGPSLNTNFLILNLNTVKEAKGGKRVGDPHLDRIKYAWFSQPDFRRAVSMAIDREAIIKSVLFGDGVKNWSSSTPGNKGWYSPQITGADYDPEGARRLLAGLGMKDQNGDGVLEDAKGNPVSFSIKTNADNRMRMSMINFVKDDLAKVGIRVTTGGADFSTLISNLREDFKYEAILLGGQTGVPPDPGMGQNVWKSSGPTHWWNMRQKRPETAAEARIDSLMDACVETIDMGRRKEAWEGIQRIVNDETFMIWLPTLVSKVPVRNRFGNVDPSPIPHRILWNIDRVFVKSQGRRA